MKFILTTEKGSQIELDTELVAEVVIGVDDKKYKILIEELPE